LPAAAQPRPARAPAEADGTRLAPSSSAGSQRWGLGRGWCGRRLDRFGRGCRRRRRRLAGAEQLGV